MSACEQFTTTRPSVGESAAARARRHCGGAGFWSRQTAVDPAVEAAELPPTQQAFQSSRSPTDPLPFPGYDGRSQAVLQVVASLTAQLRALDVVEQADEVRQLIQTIDRVLNC